VVLVAKCKDVCLSSLWCMLLSLEENDDANVVVVVTDVVARVVVVVVVVVAVYVLPKYLVGLVQ
jgi:predicted branched-subunit amino acid permease